MIPRENGRRWALKKLRPHRANLVVLRDRAASAIFDSEARAALIHSIQFHECLLIAEFKTADIPVPADM